MSSGDWIAASACGAPNSGICLPPIVVPPNTEFRGEVVIWGAETGQRLYNAFRVPAIDGEYRLVWNQPVHHYHPGPGSFGDTLQLANRVSNQFTLVRAQVTKVMPE